MTHLILGELNQPQNLSMDNFNFFNTNFTEDVIEKPEIASTVGTQYKMYESVDLEEVYYSCSKNS